MASVYWVLRFAPRLRWFRPSTSRLIGTTVKVAASGSGRYWVRNTIRSDWGTRVCSPQSRAHSGLSRRETVGVRLVRPTYIFRFIIIVFTVSPDAACVACAAPPSERLHDVCCKKRVDAMSRRPLSLRRFARVCAASRRVYVIEWDLGVPTGEWDERDAKSKGNVRHDVTHEACML